MEARITITSLKTEMAEDNRTEAQKALGIHPEKAEVDPKDDDLGRDPIESEDETGESEESSESPDEADKDDDEDDEPFEPKDEDASKKKEVKKEAAEDTVPLKRLLDEKKANKELKARIEKLEAKFGEGAEDELVSQMAKELNIQPEHAKKLLDFSSKSILSKLERDGRIITPELKEKLEKLESGKEELDEAKIKQDAERKEIEYYREEWSDFLPNLKKQYKNATPSMLKEAAQEMYKLARSRTYGNVQGEHPAYPLDFVFFKEKKVFDTLLRVSPKAKSGETGHDIEGEDNETIDFTDPNLSPAKYQRFVAQRNAKKLAEERAGGTLKFR
jgi:hypothetical protein